MQSSRAVFFFAVFWYGYLGYNYFTVRVCQGDSQRLFVRDYFLDVGRCHWCFFLAKWNSKTSEVHSSAFMDKIGFWWSSTFMSMTYLICYTYSPYSNGRFLFFGLSLSPHPPPTKRHSSARWRKNWVLINDLVMITSQVMTRFNSTRFEFIFTSLVPRFF